MSSFDSAISGIKRLLRDVVGPLFGMFLVLQLGLGRFDTPAIPVIATLASALIGIPFWSRSDERRRDSNDGDDAPRRKKKRRVTIDWGGDGDDSNE